MVREHKPEEESLDRDIASLKRQVASLRKRLQLECSTILSAVATQKLIQSAVPLNPSAPSSSSDALAKRSSQQEAYVQQCAYRISTCVTAFKIHDPDPNAVDGGNVLGIRFEVMSTGQFLRPYYVMLNRPYADSRHLRVHRHTIPPAVPLSGLAARHLPPPRFDGVDQTTQDLQRFVRTLRRDIIRYHNRLGVTADLRRSARLHQRARGAQSGRAIVDVGIADIEAKQITLAWADDRSGRIIVDEDGKILKFVVFGSGGRDWSRSNDLLGSSDRVEDIAAALDEFTKT